MRVGPALTGIASKDELSCLLHGLQNERAVEGHKALAVGWGDRQTDDEGILTRAVSIAPDHPAQVYLHHPQGKSLTLEITALAELPQRVTLFANGELAGQIEVAQKFGNYSFNLPPLTDEVVALKFQSDQPESALVARRLGLRASE